MKPKAASRVAEQVSCGPSPCCSPPGRPLPIKSLALLARVSPWTIHFQALDESPLSGPGRGPLPATKGGPLPQTWFCQYLPLKLRSLRKPQCLSLTVLVKGDQRGSKKQNRQHFQARKNTWTLLLKPLCSTDILPQGAQLRYFKSRQPSILEFSPL